MVHGRDRELRVIGAFAGGLDPTILVVNGLSGIGKSVTVLAALHQAGAQASAVRVVRSCSPRPYAQGLVGRRRLDLSPWTAQAGPEPEHHLDPVGLVEAVTTGIQVTGPGPRVLFVDDVEVLTPGRAAWLQRLADVAYEREWRVIAATRHVCDPVLPDDIDLLDLGPLDEAALSHGLDVALRLPVAADIAARLQWWSSGNLRVALELADGLSAAQLRGSTEWTGPDSAGPAARRAYRILLDGLDPAASSDLAEAAVRLRSGEAVPEVRHPLLALLCLERAGPPLDVGGPAVPDPASAMETILDGLHLDDLPDVPTAQHAPRAAARAVGVALLTGQAWPGGETGPRVPMEADPEWTDHLWWKEADAADDAARAAGARVAAALVALESTGRLPDPAGLRADLDRIGATPGRHWVGVCLQVRGHLLLGDVAGARKLLEDCPGAASGRTVAEIVARDVAAARVAVVDGRAADARAHLVHAARLRPNVDAWLPARGLRIATDAMLDGCVPTSDMPPQASAWSTRALGEFAGDLGAAHLAVGHAERAAALLTIGLERCAWPYRGRAHARADLVEAVVAAGQARDGLPDRVRGLIEPPVEPYERADADAAAAHARTHAMLAGSGAPPTGVDGWLPGSPRRVSLWQRLRSLVAYGHHCLAHGDRAASEQVLREARTLARLAGTPGWRAADTGLAVTDRAPGPNWDRLSGNEREIVRLALRGATNAQIAAVAYVSVRTVANRLRQIYALLGVRDRRDLTEQAQADPPSWQIDLS